MNEVIYNIPSPKEWINSPERLKHTLSGIREDNIFDKITRELFNRSYSELNGNESELVHDCFAEYLVFHWKDIKDYLIGEPHDAQMPTWLHPCGFNSGRGYNLSAVSQMAGKMFRKEMEQRRAIGESI